MDMHYKLRLLTLKCYLPDETSGDEIYLISGGEKIWPTDAKYLTISAEETPLNVEFHLEKGDSFPIEIWDHDKLSSNDRLGSLVIEAENHGQFTVNFSKTGKDKSSYALQWEIG